MRKIQFFAALVVLAAPILAQNRITRPVDRERRATLPGRLPAQVRPENDLGRLDRNQSIQKRITSKDDNSLSTHTQSAQDFEASKLPGWIRFCLNS